MLKKITLSLALCLAALISPWAAIAQQKVTIPAQKFNVPVTIGGTTFQIPITVPAQDITIPAPAAPVATLPTGFTWTNGIFTVPGSIKATSLDVSNGIPLPVSASGLYLMQVKGGFLEPTPYVPYIPPATK